MDLLLLADIDDLRWRHGGIHADVLIALGDLADSLLLDAAHQCRCNHILAVKGNHDCDAPFPEPVIDLHLQSVVLGGLRFAGFAGCAKYKQRGRHLFTQHEATHLLADLPPVDVMLAHNSPAGVHERDAEAHAGFHALRRYLEVHRPRLLAHGHQHVNADTLVGSTLVAGVHGHRAITVVT